MSEIRLFASVTDITADDIDVVAVTGSHGGIYPASVASLGGLRAVAFNDAGGGAGIVGLAALDTIGMAAVAVDCFSCHIGSAEDAVHHGEVSYANQTARAVGVAPGQRMAEASSHLRHAQTPALKLDPMTEVRQIERYKGLDLHLLDSASIVTAEDRDRILITGSHGGLVGNDPSRALKADARLAVFNDAGRGKDDTGIARLAPLGQRGVAALTVAHDSARIGDAASSLETGIISAVNEPAATMGAECGMKLTAFLSVIAPAA